MIDCIGNGDSIESKLGISINPLYAKPLPKVSKPGVVLTEGGIIIDKSSVDINSCIRVSTEIESEVESR